jgi:RNA polymerase sigma-70 factor, ECF subfamily
MATALMTAPTEISWVDRLRGGDQEDLAQQAADDALMAVLGKLDQFRGESRFTTWAYKFALLEAAVKIRRRAWQGREVLVAVALNGVPIDVLAERLGSTRGALYKNLHDVRRKLRQALAERRFRVGASGEEER